MVSGHAFRPVHALGHLQRTGLHRIVAAGLGRSLLVEPLDQDPRRDARLPQAVFRPQSPLQSDTFFARNLGGGGQKSRDEVRGLHHQTPRRLLHVRHAQTDFRVTAPDCPFSKNPRANIAREVFQAFRKEGLGIGCYFSKSDWHCPYYWSEESTPLDRNPNYDTAKQPQRWGKFVQFVHGQVEELLTGYGPIDILWLDGGQVRPPSQDIQMDRLVAMARRHQPRLLVVDRTVGRYEDYRTPEQEVPAKPLPYVWESCLTMGEQWSYKPDDKYKSPRQLIHLLADIAAKGGNLLLNIGPRPDGTLPPEAVKRLEEIGRWMAVNGGAIHGTRPWPPYKQGQVAFTHKGDHVYAIYLAGEGETSPPRQLRLRGLTPRKDSAIRLLGHGEACRWRTDAEGLQIDLPAEACARPPCAHAWVLQVEVVRAK